MKITDFNKNVLSDLELSSSKGGIITGLYDLIGYIGCKLDQGLARLLNRGHSTGRKMDAMMEDH